MFIILFLSVFDELFHRDFSKKVKTKQPTSERD
jgi:hypothetical protein